MTNDEMTVLDRIMHPANDLIASQERLIVVMEEHIKLLNQKINLLEAKLDILKYGKVRQ